MKHVILSFIILFLFSGCVEEQTFSVVEDLLVGEWTGVGLELTVNEDGTGNIKYSGYDFDFTYKELGDNIIEVNLPFPVGTRTITYEFCECGNNIIDITFNGGIYRLNRV